MPVFLSISLDTHLIGIEMTDAYGGGPGGAAFVASYASSSCNAIDAHTAQYSEGSGTNVASGGSQQQLIEGTRYDFGIKFNGIDWNRDVDLELSGCGSWVPTAASRRAATPDNDNWRTTWLGSRPEASPSPCLSNISNSEISCDSRSSVFDAPTISRRSSASSLAPPPQEQIVTKKRRTDWTWRPLVDHEDPIGKNSSSWRHIFGRDGFSRGQQLGLLRDEESLTSLSLAPSQITKSFGVLEGDPSPIYRPLNVSTKEARFLEILPLSRNVSGTTRLHLEKGTRDVSGSLITCRLIVRSMNDYPSYEALSYAWGDIGPDPEYIILEGQQILVRPNLSTALRGLQYESVSRIMWIDALCINQDDDKEKGDQVARMGEIYRRAKRVVISLGKEENGMIKGV
jgi:hypothetical protein